MPENARIRRMRAKTSAANRPIHGYSPIVTPFVETATLRVAACLLSGFISGGIRDADSRSRSRMRSRKICVFPKMVPEPVEEPGISANGKKLDMQWLRMIVSEPDDHALQQALILKKKHDGTVTAVASEAPKEAFRAESLLNSVACSFWMAKRPRDVQLTQLLLPPVKEAVDAGADALSVSCSCDISRSKDALERTEYDKKMFTDDTVELLGESLGGA